MAYMLFSARSTLAKMINLTEWISFRQSLCMVHQYSILHQTQTTHVKFPCIGTLVYLSLMQSMPRLPDVESLFAHPYKSNTMPYKIQYKSACLISLMFLFIGIRHRETQPCVPLYVCYLTAGYSDIMSLYNWQSSWGFNSAKWWWTKTT